MEANQWWAIGIGVLGLATFLATLWVLRRRHLIEEVPTSTCRGVFMGLNEVKGVAESGKPLVSDLARTECVWFHYEVTEHYRRTSTSTDSDGHVRTSSREGWEKVAEGGARVPFFLRDDTGAVRVQPEAASVEGVKVFDMNAHVGDTLFDEKAPNRRVEGSTGRRRYIEHAIPVGADLYVLGPARLRDDAVEPEIAADFSTGPFMITMKDEQQLVYRYNGYFAVLFIVTVAAAAGVPVALGYPDAIDPLLASLAAAGVFVAIGLAWLVLTYNGLVSLREREARAWSLIEVQLRRRHDLIPALATVVEGYATQEQQAQTELAGLRPGEPPQSDDRAPSEAEVRDGDAITAQQTSALRTVLAVAERYPDLRADASFTRLQAELVDTEDRIAVARQFFNDSVTALRDRSGRFPVNVLAAVFGFRSRQLYAAEGFERAVPSASGRPDPGQADLDAELNP